MKKLICVLLTLSLTLALFLGAAAAAVFMRGFFGI